MAPQPDPLSASQTSTTFPSSDSENYSSSAPHDPTLSPSDEDSPSSPRSSPLILYSPPTFWSIVRGAAINLVLPFVNGMMLGFGELCAHEAAWRLGWGGTKVFPSHRNIGPGLEMREDPVERRRRDGEEMEAYTNME